MELVRGIQQLSQKQSTALKNTVVTIGNFDGVHLGHRKIIELTLKKARAAGGPAVAYTFRPHPQLALRPDAKLSLLSTYDEKIELLGALGLDIVIEEPFSREFSTTSPEQFFNNVLLRRLNAVEIVVGYDFAFGKGREGHLEALEGFCKRDGVALTVVPPFRVDNEIVSSSRIRERLLEGDTGAAAKLLGRPFSYKGVVIRGEQRGRKLGFPTANLRLENKLAIPYGVYATWARVVSGEAREPVPSVTNVGIRPTFPQLKAGDPSSRTEIQELPALIETHLLSAPSGMSEPLDLYGSTLEVLFVKRLREERKFSGHDFLTQLKQQIARDADQARTLLANAPKF